MASWDRLVGSLPEHSRFSLEQLYFPPGLGTILAQSGVSNWEMQWWYSSRAAGPSTRNRYPSATLIFRKNEQKASSTAPREARSAQPASAAAPLHGAG